MEEHLLKILATSSRVIIPEFGAFIVKQKNPLSIVFNEFLQYNDGLLVDFIAKEEGIERETAKKKVDDFVRRVHGELNKDNMVSLGELGVLVKNQTGKISLEAAGTEIKKSAPASQHEPGVKEPEKKEELTVPEADEIHLDEATEAQKDEEPVEEKPVEKKPKIEEKKKEPLVSPTKKEDSSKPEEIKPKQEEVKSQPEPTPKPKPQSEAETEKAESEYVTPKPPVEEPKKIVPETERSEHRMSAAQDIRPSEPVHRDLEPKEYSAPSHNKRRRRINILIWVIILVIVNGSIVFYFLKSDQFGGYFTKKAPKPVQLKSEDTTGLFQRTRDTAHALKAPKTKIQTVKKVNIKTPRPVTAKQEKTTEGPRFYIVAGAFRSEKNADALVRRLREKGFKAEKFGKIRNLYGVSYDSYSTKAEADQALLKIKKETDKHAWIKKME